uniref:Uncharacterized protein n=1 Tax=Faecalibaculum rodentium TaxID=1702221 RepID=A0A140DYM6_9FIRM|nr:hypothetical protein AALO17_26190 [Faecalibaculum rodentium]
MCSETAGGWQGLCGRNNPGSVRIAGHDTGSCSQLPERNET